MGRIIKAARPRFNVISGVEDFINVLNDLKNYPYVLLRRLSDPHDLQR
jgi:hypothetical protein